MIESICFEHCLNDSEISNLNPISLAFLGDAVWSVLIREFFCSNSTFKSNELHKLSTKFVRASFQATLYDKVYDFLTDSEKEISKRARNAKINTLPKNASLSEYKKATSFEAIIGWCYLRQDFSRIKWFYDFVLQDLNLVLQEIRK